ncbi:MAG: polysaccharide deacetylase family protein [Saprospiraceae bacterium]|nr:polysaccharide deacetylase family protein [Saprospiraceae bacterium]
MPDMICIYAPFDTPRLRYALDIAFRHILTTGYWLTRHPDTFRSFAGPRLNYSGARVSDREVWIPAGALLSKTGIQPQEIQPEQRSGRPAFFFQKHIRGADFDFDLLSLIFFLVSRYEEYLPGERDWHGRFAARRSAAFQHNFLEQPVVNRWVLHLAGMLEERFPGFRIARPAYRFLPTFDIDQAWAYRYKGVWRNAAGTVRDVLRGNWADLRRRVAVLSGKAEDPFFTFSDIEEWHRRPQSNPVFFFHLGNYGRFDKSISHRHPILRLLIARLAGAHPVGIHPSWRAAQDPARFAEEIRRFHDITGAPPLRSRQHFLRMELPATYRLLLDAGIVEDYTMGYADAPGFRAGIAGPFPWYDLEAEKTTGLILHPFTVMDVTLKEYLGLSPEAGLERATALLRSTRETGGVFCTLWHNSSFSDIGNWRPWRSMYEALRREAEG